MYMCPIPNGFRDTAISLYSSKIVDKKQILRAVSNTGIYCSSDMVGTVYLVYKLNSLALVRKQTLPAERPPLQIDCVARPAPRIPMAVNLDFLDPEPLLFHSSSSSVILTRLSGPRSRPAISQKIW
jgi:hypothetical protein